jgi:hypothetical protein
MDLSFLKRFTEVMPKATDEDLRVLKAHLLAEEGLVEYLNWKLDRPSGLPGDMAFATRLAVAKAATRASAKDDWIWDALKTLNKLRNSYAHRIDDPKRDNARTAFVNAAKAAPPWKAVRDNGGSEPDPMMIRLFVTACELSIRLGAASDFFEKFRIERSNEDT